MREHQTLLFNGYVQEFLSERKQSPNNDGEQDRKRRKLTVRKKADLDMPIQALASRSHTHTDTAPDKHLPGTTAAPSAEATSAEAAETMGSGQDLHGNPTNVQPQTDQAVSDSNQAAAAAATSDQVPSEDHYDAVTATSPVAVAVELPQAAAELPRAAAELPQAAAELLQAVVVPQVAAEMPQPVPQAAAELSQAAVELPLAVAEPRRVDAEIPQAAGEQPRAADEAIQTAIEPPQAAVQLPQAPAEATSRAEVAQYAELTAVTGSHQAATMGYAESAVHAVTNNKSRVLPHSWPACL